MPPRVSIVLPNFNYAHYLDERITSLLHQTFTDFELIVVDDASTDGSRAVIEKYRTDGRVRTLWFDDNSGQIYKRWNDGAAEATGAYLMFAGADDSCDRRLLETLVTLLDRNSEVGVAYSQSWVIDSKGARIRLAQSDTRRATGFTAGREDEALFLLKKDIVPNASAALLRRSVFEACGRFDGTLRLYADWMLWARMLQRSKVAFVAQPLNNFRRHPASAAATFSDDLRMLERYRVVEFILRAFPISEPDGEETRAQLADVWLNRLLTERLHADYVAHLRIYRVARRVDPSIHQRIAGAVSRRIALARQRRRAETR